MRCVKVRSHWSYLLFTWEIHRSIPILFNNPNAPTYYIFHARNEKPLDEKAGFSRYLSPSAQYHTLALNAESEIKTAQ